MLVEEPLPPLEAMKTQLVKISPSVSGRSERVRHHTPDTDTHTKAMRE